MARHEQQGAKGFLKHVGHFLHFVDLGVKAGEASPLQLQHPLLMDKLNALVSKDKDEQADAAQFFLKAFVKSGDLSQLYPEFFKSQARKNNPKFLLVTAKETPEQGTTFSGQWIKGFRHFVTQIHSIFKGPKALEAEFRRHASYFGIQSMDVAQTAFLASRELAEIKALQDPSQPAPAPDEEPPVLQQTREALENLESANLSTRLKGILFFTKITGATKRVQESPHQFGNFRERVEDLFKARPKIRQIVMDKIQHDDLPQLIALAAEETAYELSRRDAFGEKHADREQRVSQSALNGLLNPDRKIQARAANYFANMIAQNRTYFINKLYSGNRHFN
jgi:hypothetical protein